MSTWNGDRERSGNGLLYAGLLLGVGLVVSGVVLEMMPRSSAPAVPDPPAMPQAPEAPPQHAAAPEPAPPPARALDAWAPTSEPLPIVWLAEVIGGSAAPTGSACVVALFVARAQSEIVPERVRVECGGVVVDAPSIGGSVLEVPVGDGWYVYRAQVAGSGGGLRLSTETRRFDSAELELFVEDVSVPRRADPFLDANAGWVATMRHRLHRLAVPTHVEGALPAAIADAMRAGRPVSPGAAGTFCELTGHAVPSDRFDCRLLLRCGDTSIYGEGTSGYIPCVVADGRIITATDTNETPVDTDPRVRLDLATSVLEVSDSTPEGAWSARFRLEDDPRCTTSAAWRGTIQYEGGTRYAWTSAQTDASTVRLSWSGNGLDDAGEQVSWTADCQSGRIDARTLSTDPGVGPSVYRFWLGPRMRAMAGESGVESDQGGLMWGTR